MSHNSLRTRALTFATNVGLGVWPGFGIYCAMLTVAILLHAFNVL